MHIKACLIVGMTASLTVLSHAIYVPTDLPDGRYSITMSAHTNASAPVLIERADKQFPIRVSLPGPSTGCMSYKTTQSDAVVVRNGLEAWCNAGNQVAPYSAEFWSYGSAITYICNYSGINNGCTGAEFDTANQLINDDCGGANAGWVLIQDWQKGYGRDNKGVRICSWGINTG